MNDEANDRTKKMNEWAMAIRGRKLRTMKQEKEPKNPGTEMHKEMDNDMNT